MITAFFSMLGLCCSKHLSLLNFVIKSYQIMQRSPVLGYSFQYVGKLKNLYQI